MNLPLSKSSTDIHIMNYYMSAIDYTFFRDKESTVVVVVLVFDETKHLTKIEKLDPLAVDHI